MGTRISSLESLPGPPARYGPREMWAHYVGHGSWYLGHQLTPSPPAKYASQAHQRRRERILLYRNGLLPPYFAVSSSILSIQVFAIQSIQPIQCPSIFKEPKFLVA